MRARRAGFALLVLTTLLAVACSGDPPAAPTVEQLAGGWRLVAMKPAGQAEAPAPAGVTYSVTFAGDRMSVRADCNTCTGVYSLSGQTLTAGPTLLCSRAACPTMEFEHVYIQLVAGDSTISLSTNTLALSSPRGTLRFSR
jgi:heat shock protein HslJ